MIDRSIGLTERGRERLTGQQMACVTVDRACRALMNISGRILVIFSCSADADSATSRITHQRVLLLLLLELTSRRLSNASMWLRLSEYLMNS